MKIYTGIKRIFFAILVIPIVGVIMFNLMNFILRYFMGFHEAVAGVIASIAGFMVSVLIAVVLFIPIVEDFDN